MSISFGCGPTSLLSLIIVHELCILVDQLFRIVDDHELLSCRKPSRSVDLDCSQLEMLVYVMHNSIVRTLFISLVFWLIIHAPHALKPASCLNAADFEMADAEPQGTSGHLWYVFKTPFFVHRHPMLRIVPIGRYSQQVFILPL